MSLLPDLEEIKGKEDLLASWGLRI
jgi:hypothetical protein